jgi:hypothetical protein
VQLNPIYYAETSPPPHPSGSVEAPSRLLPGLTRMHYFHHRRVEDQGFGFAHQSSATMARRKGSLRR